MIMDSQNEEVQPWGEVSLRALHAPTPHPCLWLQAPYPDCSGPRAVCWLDVPGLTPRPFLLPPDPTGTLSRSVTLPPTTACLP